MHMLKNIQIKKHPFSNPDLKIRTHAQGDFIRSKTEKNRCLGGVSGVASFITTDERLQ